MEMKEKIINLVALFVVGFVAGCIVTSWRLSASIAGEKAEVVQANADHFRDATKMINEAATEHVRNTDELNKQIAELKKELAHAKKNHPVPADCRPDADRLRVLKDAVRAANATAGQ